MSGLFVALRSMLATCEHESTCMLNDHSAEDFECTCLIGYVPLLLDVSEAAEQVVFVEWQRDWDEETNLAVLERNTLFRDALSRLRGSVDIEPSDGRDLKGGVLP